MLIEGEDVQAAYKLVRDMFVFTDKRLIVMDKQGMTGKKVSYLTVPYGSIVSFAKESAGHFDLESELKIWIRGQSDPLAFEFKKDSSIDGDLQDIELSCAVKKEGRTLPRSGLL